MTGNKVESGNDGIKILARISCIMKKIIVLLTAVMVVLAAYSTGWCSQKKGPRAVVADKEFRFDPLPEGAMVYHTFMIKNTGDEILNIKKVKTT